VKEVVAANTHEVKQIPAHMPRLVRCGAGRIDAYKRCRIIKMRARGGEPLVPPVTIPPKEIPDPRSFFPAYRLCQKQNTRLKSRIHSLLKERLCGFTQEEIFGKQSRKKLREISVDSALKFPNNLTSLK
jgi:hypothetical protein